MKNSRFKICLALVILTTQASVLAATEYIRLEGFVDNEYITLPDGLVEGQFVYFDFLVDTEIDPNPFWNDFWFEEFLAINIGGNYPVNVVNSWAGSDASGYIYRILQFQDSLTLQERIDCNFAVPPPRCDHALDFDWVAGSSVELLLNGFDSLGFFEVTYRDSTPPPPIPIPAALWLLVSALVGTLGLQKKKPTS